MVKTFLNLRKKMAYFMFLYQLHANRQLRCERVFRDWTNPMELFDEKDFYERFRFTKAGVTFLCNLLQHDLSPVCNRTRAISYIANENLYRTAILCNRIFPNVNRGHQ